MSKMKDFIVEVKELYQKGYSIDQIAQMLGGSLDMVTQALECDLVQHRNQSGYLRNERRIAERI